MLTIGSLFAGIGGLDLGLERAGLGPVRWQAEMDPDARRVLRKHWPDAKQLEDVRFVKPGRGLEVDLICGGFPCQDVSYAGTGKGLDGERSGLWFEFARVVRDLRPRVVVVENVSALLRRGIDAVLGTLAALGYDATWHCITAAAVGAPHRRDRLFMVAWRVSDPDGEPERGKGRAQATDERNTEPRHVGGDVAERAADAFAGSTFGDAVADSDRWRLAIERVARRHEERCARGDDAHGHHLPAWPYGPGDERWADIPAEAQPAIRGVVDGVPSRVARLRLLGNAVVPVVGEVIGEVIVGTLKGCER